MRRFAGGFTLVELVTVIVILGILAAVVIPRMDTSGYRSTEFHDRTVAALRFAQKTATSHRRLVCVTFPDTHTLQLDVDTDKNGICDTALAVPGSSSNRIISTDPVNAVFNALPASLNFSAVGTSPSGSVSITFKGADDVIVSGATGYVQ